MAENREKSSLLRGTSIVAALNLISRVLGFIEQLCIATFFGAGGLTDAFFNAFKIPNLLRSLVAEGALTSAFVPVFTSELNVSKERAQRLLRSVTTLLCLITLTLSFLGVIFAPEIVSFVAPGFGLDTERGKLCVLLTRIMFPYIMFVSLVAMLNGAFNSVNHYGAAPLAQITMNIILIFGVIIGGQFLPKTGLIIVGITVIIGGIAQIIIQIPTLKKTQLSLVPSRDFITPQTKQILLLMAPAVFGAAVYQVSIIINTILASLLPEGSVSWLSYADRLAQLPIGVFTVSLASTLLPTLSRASAQNDSAAFASSLNDSLRYTSFCMIPFAFLMYYFAMPVTEIVFERGHFNHFNTIMTAQAVQAMAFGLWGVSCNSMAMRGFIAKKDTVTPVLIGILSLLVNIFISLTVMGTPVSQGFAANVISNIQSVLPITYSCGHVGLALATGLASTFTLVIPLWLLDKRNNGISWRPFFKAVVKTIIAASAMFICLNYRQSLFTLGLYASLIFDGCLALLLFTFFAKILKIKELEETFHTLERIYSRITKR